MSMEKLLSARVIACAYEVSKSLGSGFLEAVYENALCMELKRDGIHFEKQKQLKVNYKGSTVGHYVCDIIIENKLLLELKALPTLSNQHEAQVMNYLKATGITVGLLLNFGTPKLGIRRIVWQYNEIERI